LAGAPIPVSSSSVIAILVEKARSAMVIASRPDPPSL
jgi:hypothetical protein